MRVSFLTRLVVSFLLAIGATGAIATVMGSYLIGQRFVRQAQGKVAQDINSARLIYEHEVERMQDVVRLTANRFSVRGAIRRHDLAHLTSVFAEVRRQEGLDLLTLTDLTGAALVRAPAVRGAADAWAHRALVRRVIERRAAVAGTEVLARDELARESTALAARARVALVPTPKARPTAQRELTSGMLMLAGAPVTDTDGKLLAVLYGGKLLNHNLELVDRIKDTVYRGEVYRGQEIGTATLFLGEVRIATCVRTPRGQRALGTRIQAEVGDRVLGEGRPWTERAFVVDGWYLTAYEPIRDLASRVVGVLYVGVREDKFVAVQRQTVLAFLGVTVGGMALAALVACLLARSVLLPIKRLVAASGEISSGNFEHRLPESSPGELGGLERAFNRMTEAILERDRQIREQAEAQIIRKANLASLGQLAASLAHEVNNPLSGILIYLRLLGRTLSKRPFPAERLPEMLAWLGRMEAEGARCGRLISGMLQLGREPPMKIAEHELSEIVERALAFLEHRFALGNVSLVRELDPALGGIECDAEQIQQTMMGLLLNAFEAMPRGGTIRVAARRDPARDGVQLRVSDTGVGIAPENLPRIFDAFFTTKGESKGVGLGLSIAQAIARRHGGRIEVESQAGRGSIFTLSLPCRRAEQPGAQQPMAERR